MSDRPGRRTRADHARGLPDHHDPTAGIGGAPPAQSALTLRLVLAVFGLLVCVAGGIVVLAAGAPLWFAVVLFALAAVALVDLVVVARRKLRGEPG
jgi:membrane protein implicated in regulation of membrane protease activity